MNAPMLVRHLATALCISIFWYAIWKLNDLLFPFFVHTMRASWIFLPAAFRPLIILVFGPVGAAGLVLGAYLTVIGTTPGGAVGAMAFSLVLGLTPWLSVSLGKRWLDIPASLAGLRPTHIVVLSTLCAAVNAITLNGYLWFAGALRGDLVQVWTVLFGDLLGSAIVLLLASNLLAFAMPRPR